MREVVNESIRFGSRVLNKSGKGHQNQLPLLKSFILYLRFSVDKAMKNFC